MQYFKEFVHNVFIHPLIMFMPRDLGDKIHERNAQWAFDLEEGEEE